MGAGVAAMSADNMIYVQKRGDRWWVWMGFASDERNAPSRRAANFETEGEAMKYAFTWYAEEAVVEYGVIPLPEMKSRKKKAVAP
jgi:hypothetical protein